MDTIHGTVTTVTAFPLGDRLAAAASSGAGSVTVYDASDFDELGGTLRIGGPDPAAQVITYTAADVTANTVTLASTLVAGWPVDTPVELWDTNAGTVFIDYRALVDIGGDVDNSGVLDAAVEHALVPLLPEGIRDPGEGESVTLTSTSIGIWTVTDIHGRQPSFAGPVISYPDGATAGQRLELSGDGIKLFDASDNQVISLESTDDNQWLAPLAAVIFGSGVPLLGGATGSAWEIWQRGSGAFALSWLNVVSGSQSHSDALQVSRTTDPAGGSAVNLVKIPARVGSSDGSLIQIGNGLPGGYYSEGFEGFSPSLTSGSLTTINPTSGTQTLSSDYGSAWAGSTWTCPVTADYDIASFLPNVFQGDWANVHRILLNGTTAIAQLGVNIGAVHSPGIDTLTTVKRLTAGDTLQFLALQASGSSRAVGAASRIHIARRL